MLQDNIVEDVVLPHWHDDNMLAPNTREWPSMEAAKDDIKGYLQSRNIPSRTRQSNKQRYELVCPRMKWDPPVSCDFIIAAWRYDRKDGVIRIHKSSLNHSCGCMLEAGSRYNMRYNSKWAGMQTMGLIHDVSRQTRPVHIQASLRRQFGASVSYRTALRGRDYVRRIQSSDVIKSFQLIKPYFTKLEKRMPGTHTALERDREDRLLRTFVMLSPLLDALRCSRPVMSFDACSLRGSYTGVLMATTIVDGEGHILLLAWGTAPIENRDHWEWFAANLYHGLPEDLKHQRFTVISDREKGIESALRLHFPECFHAYCMRHIVKNVVSQCTKVRKSTKDLMWVACKAFRRPDCLAAMNSIRQENQEVYNYLIQIPLDRWTNSHAPHPKFGHVTSNPSESMNNWIGEIRDHTHIGLHAGIVHKCMHDLCQKRKAYNSVNTPFPKNITAKMNEVNNIGKTLHVQESTDNWYLVDQQFEVYMGDQPSCMCGQYTQLQLPCKHMAAALSASDDRSDYLFRYVHSSYSTESLRGVYAGIIPPCSTADLEPDGVTLPQAHSRQRGRPRKSTSVAPTKGSLPMSRAMCVADAVNLGIMLELVQGSSSNGRLVYAKKPGKRSSTSGTSRNKASLFLQEGEEGDLEKILLLPSLLLVHQQGKQCRNPGYSLPQKVRRGVLTMRVKEEDALNQFPEENDELGTKNQKITTEKTKTTVWSFSKLKRKRT